MGIDKINDIQGHQISQEKAREATSGKKNKTSQTPPEVKHTSLEDSLIFSDDAKRLQETEVILQNALQKLKEMDEINDQNLLGIQEKIENNFYLHEGVLEEVIDSVIPDEHLRATLQKRITAERYVPRLQEMDNDPEIDPVKINAIKDKVASGFYNSSEVLSSIADNLVELID